MNSIVIARYKEALDWIVRIPDGFEIYIYNKGDAITDQALINKAHHIINRPNIGRESETYLHHMLTHARSDDDFTVYCQGDPFTHSPDFLQLLSFWREWDDLQPLTWQWRSDHNVPPAAILADYEKHLNGRLRVRPERFSLFTWANTEFVDEGAQRTSRDFRQIHGALPEGTNVASHFLRMCRLNDLADKADAHCLGVFCYGAIFAARNSIVAKLPAENIQLLLQASKGAMVYGYVMERIWLHLFGADFELPRSRPAPIEAQHYVDAHAARALTA